MKKIALFGGTFDPIHFGHLNLALRAKELAGLDEVWFCPAKQNPHKDQAPLVDPIMRAEMVGLAISPINGFHVLLSEIERPGPSYTIDTIRRFKEDLAKTDPSFELYYLLGDESLDCFPYWKDAASILEEVRLLVGKRAFQKTLFAKDVPSELIDKLQKSLIDTPLLEISSTEIRQRLKNSLYNGFLMPDKVIDYIFKHQLYYTINAD